MRLSTSDYSVIVNALHIAADQYDADRLITLQDTTVGATVRERVAAAFAQQRDEARRLADYIEGAE